jgi:hypothetical protein
MHQLLSGDCLTFGCLGTWPGSNKRIPAHRGMTGSCLDSHREVNMNSFLGSIVMAGYYIDVEDAGL